MSQSSSASASESTSESKTTTGNGLDSGSNNSTGAKVVKVSNAGTSTKLVIGDSKSSANVAGQKTELPKTGEADTELLTTLGLTSVATLLALIAAKKRRKQD